MKVIGTTFFAIFLTMSPVAIVNAQTQPITAPDVATKSDLQKATAGLSKALKQNAAELKAEIKAERAQQAKARADAQRAADNAASDKRDADQKAELARQADAKMWRNALIATIGLVIVMVGAGVFFITKKRQTQTTPWISQHLSPAPENLYGDILSPAQVITCLKDNKLREARFTIDLPNDKKVFEYRAVTMPDGNVMASFAGNEKPVSLEHQKLRKIAKQLYTNGTLQPIELKSTGIRRVV